MDLIMKIRNIKCIENLDFQFPLNKGIYAITGENGAGKSTLISCASTVFYQLPRYDFFGRPQNASISFELESSSRGWEFVDGRWLKTSDGPKMELGGFYEGSIIFGNRFKNTRFSVIRILDNLGPNDLLAADEFVKAYLGLILRDDKNFYKKLWKC